MVSGKKALQMAGLEKHSNPEGYEKLDKTRVGVLVGTGMGGITVKQDGKTMQCSCTAHAELKKNMTAILPPFPSLCWARWPFHVCVTRWALATCVSPGSGFLWWPVSLAPQAWRTWCRRATRRFRPFSSPTRSRTWVAPCSLSIRCGIRQRCESSRMACSYAPSLLSLSSVLRARAPAQYAHSLHISVRVNRCLVHAAEAYQCAVLVCRVLWAQTTLCPQPAPQPTMLSCAQPTTSGTETQTLWW